MTISGFDGLSRLFLFLSLQKKKTRELLFFRVVSIKTRFVRSRTSVLQNDKMCVRICTTRSRGTRAPRYHRAPGADLLCGPVKHLYRLIRGELTACPVAVESRNREPARAPERARIIQACMYTDDRTLIRSDRCVECGAFRARVCESGAFSSSLFVGSLSLACWNAGIRIKPFDILFPSINNTADW